MDTLVNTEQLLSAAATAAEDRVADLVSSRTGAKGLSPLLEKDKKDDWVDRGATLLDQKATKVKVSPQGCLEVY